MPSEFARSLFESGRGHALSADLLYRASIEEGRRREVADPDLFAFNGPYSLSVNYLLGLGLELMLKASLAKQDPSTDDRRLRGIGHDLLAAFDAAQQAGFTSSAQHLRAILEVMNEPYKAHWFRYDRPAEIPLPGDFSQIVETLEILDAELASMLWADEKAPEV
jgi:hypothetical protein